MRGRQVLLQSFGSDSQVFFQRGISHPKHRRGVPSRPHDRSNIPTSRIQWTTFASYGDHPSQTASETDPAPGETTRVGGSTIREKLSAAGLAGLVAYGLSNTLYYTVAFLFVWFKIAAVTLRPGQGLLQSGKAVFSTLALVWAGSQVTKVPRALAALLAAPLVDRWLTWLRDRFKLPSKRSAFVRIVLPACVGFALVLFGSIVLIWM